ncbi:MAG: hypothetical protein CFE29_17540 [Bradyrhizobiaceae bacterium PARB1]|jgi:hypothetical protein|nr:MAG: hypothetical protein CFE29_17540 [Bradyrhizobiaceae bacterium PARB1]
MMRRVLQPFWFLLALIFLIEAWLWDHLEPVVARVVALIPLRAFKEWCAVKVAGLSPYPSLLVFIAPLVLLLVPLKFAEVYLLTHHLWISAIVLIVASKFIGMGVLAFSFDVTRDKLLQIGWFRRLFTFLVDIRQRARDLVAPVMSRIRAKIAALRGPSSRWLRFAQRLRHRAHMR